MCCDVLRCIVMCCDAILLRLLFCTTMVLYVVSAGVLRQSGFWRCDLPCRCVKVPGESFLPKHGTT